MAWTYALWVCFALVALVLAGFGWVAWDASREPRRLRKIIRRVTGVVATPAGAGPSGQEWDTFEVARIVLLGVIVIYRLAVWNESHLWQAAFWIGGAPGGDLA